MKIFICALDLAAGLDYIAHHVDPDEISHFGIHLLSFEQLES